MTKQILVSVLFAVLISIALQACGQKGPLYLPDEPQHEQEQDDSE